MRKSIAESLPNLKTKTSAVYDYYLGDCDNVILDHLKNNLMLLETLSVLVNIFFVLRKKVPIEITILYFETHNI